MRCPKRRRIHLYTGCRDPGQGRLRPAPASLWRPVSHLIHFLKEQVLGGGSG